MKKVKEGFWSYRGVEAKKKKKKPCLMFLCLRDRTEKWGDFLFDGYKWITKSLLLICPIVHFLNYI